MDKKAKNIKGMTRGQLKRKKRKEVTDAAEDACCKLVIAAFFCDAGL